MLIALIFVLSMMSLGSWLLGMTLAPAYRHSTSQWRAWKMQTIVKSALRDLCPQQPNCLPVRQPRTRVHRVAHVHVFPSLFAHYRRYNHPNSALHAQPHGKARYLPLKYWSKRQYKLELDPSEFVHAYRKSTPEERGRLSAPSFFQLTSNRSPTDRPDTRS